jgi:uncharacterized protein (TIGR03437 family)
MSIFGSGLSTTIQSASTVPLSVSVGDVSSVTVAGTNAPVLVVSPGQITAQVPWEAVPGPADLVVTNSAGASQTVSVTVAEFAPMILTLNFGTTAQAYVINQDGTLNGSGTVLGSIPTATAHAENSGNNITIYATGLGPVSSPPPDGSPSSDQPRPTLNTPFVTIGGVFANVVSSGLSAQYPGVYAVVVTVPFGITLGNDVPIQIQMSDAATGNSGSSTNLATMASR